MRDRLKMLTDSIVILPLCSPARLIGDAQLERAAYPSGAHQPVCRFLVGPPGAAVRYARVDHLAASS